ncbi:hypothetical protein [Bacillus sp. JCM 19034]|uniref:hypothetical protein n=1 Tax=Bacillus sp. JCM 19034 TaxID=1481928 RepID=UPI0007820584|nr:hypothetical protein [Bacillus sp. JCM 19034]
MEITELKNTVTKIKRVTKWKIHGFMIPIWFVFSLWMFPEFPLSTVDLYIDFLFTRLFPIIGTYVVFFLTLYNIPFDPSKK